MCHWNQDLANLREVLSGLFWETLDARTIAIDAGLDPASIHLSSKPRLLWQSILDDAKARCRIPDVIEQACKRYPENPYLSSQKRISFTSRSGRRTSLIRIGRARPVARPWKS